MLIQRLPHGRSHVLPLLFIDFSADPDGNNVIW